MRALAAMIAILTGLVLLAMPAAAHRADHKAVPSVEQRKPQTAPDAEPRICVFSLNGTRAQRTPSKSADDKTKPAHKADPAHDPNDHSHPLGEDTHHEKASHSSLDVADEQRQSNLKRDAPQKPQSPVAAERVCGIDVTPPVPPPLG